MRSVQTNAPIPVDRPRALLAVCLALLADCALAEDRHWIFIGGCGTSTDWFGKTNGVMAEGQTNCWGTGATGGSGLPMPT